MNPRGKKIVQYLKSLAFLGITLTMTLLPDLAQAQLLGEGSQSSEYRFRLAADVFSFEYEEPDFMKEEGLMYGISGDYTVRNGTGFSFGVDGRFSYGQVDYDSNGTGSIDDINDFAIETRAKVGYDVTSGELETTPYLGIGYRFLRDQSGGETSSTGHSGYDRESNYFYIPVGLDITKNFSGSWAISLNVEYDFFIQGLQVSELGDAVSGGDDLENDQDEGYGVRGSIRLAQVGEESYHFFIEPFIRYWDIEDSDLEVITVGGNPIGFVGQEPANNTTEIGIKLGVIF